MPPFRSKPELEAWIKQKAKTLGRPTVILLHGEMGVGKTQTVKWICEALGVTEAASPTFAVHHEYRVNKNTMDHLDLYRLKDDAELENCGFWDLLSKPDVLLMVEWASRLPPDIWPAHWTRIDVQITKGVNQEDRIVEWSETRP